MNAETDDLVRDFVADGGNLRDWKGVYSVAPTRLVPIVLEHADQRGEIHRELELARWDWEKPAKMPQSRALFNARSEKLKAGMWTVAFSSSRCIVPMIGYFEFTGEAGAKVPHFLHSEDGELLAAAGLTWHMNVGDERVRSYVVVTREARDASGGVHDRMPAFLEPGMWDEWLNPASLTVKGDVAASKAQCEALLQDLLSSSDKVASTIQGRVVDRAVNNSRTPDRYDPRLIEPVDA